MRSSASTPCPPQISDADSSAKPVRGTRAGPLRQDRPSARKGGTGVRAMPSAPQPPPDPSTLPLRLPVRAPGPSEHCRLACVQSRGGSLHAWEHPGRGSDCTDQAGLGTRANDRILGNPLPPTPFILRLFDPQTRTPFHCPSITVHACRLAHGIPMQAAWWRTVSVAVRDPARDPVLGVTRSHP